MVLSSVHSQPALVPRLLATDIVVPKIAKVRVKLTRACIIVVYSSSRHAGHVGRPSNSLGAFVSKQLNPLGRRRPVIARRTVVRREHVPYRVFAHRVLQVRVRRRLAPPAAVVSRVHPLWEACLDKCVQPRCQTRIYPIREQRVRPQLEGDFA